MPCLYKTEKTLPEIVPQLVIEICKHPILSHKTIFMLGILRNALTKFLLLSDLHNILSQYIFQLRKFPNIYHKLKYIIDQQNKVPKI